MCKPEQGFYQSNSERNDTTIQIDLDVLRDRLTKRFTYYVYRSDNPMPSDTETPAVMQLQYQNDPLFRRRVECMVYSVLEAVENSQVKDRP